LYCIVLYIKCGNFFFNVWQTQIEFVRDVVLLIIDFLAVDVVAVVAVVVIVEKMIGFRRFASTGLVVMLFFLGLSFVICPEEF
jgi:hypothetical protein